eukprot:ctg_7189.g704
MWTAAGPAGADDFRDRPAGRHQRGHVTGDQRRLAMQVLQKVRHEDLAAHADHQQAGGRIKRAER